jgi:hypothetical protein
MEERDRSKWLDPGGNRKSAVFRKHIGLASSHCRESQAMTLDVCGLVGVLASKGITLFPSGSYRFDADLLGAIAQPYHGRTARHIRRTVITSTIGRETAACVSQPQLCRKMTPSARERFNLFDGPSSIGPALRCSARTGSRASPTLGCGGGRLRPTRVIRRRNTSSGNRRSPERRPGGSVPPSPSASCRPTLASWLSS